MAKDVDFLTTRGIGDVLERIISRAQEEIVLVSPYVDIPSGMFERLLSADRRGVSITIVYGKSTLSTEVMGLLNQLQHLALYFDKKLHAKCYYNEEAMIISSMNLYDYSERNNHEMGILIEEGNPVYGEAREEVKHYISVSEIIREPVIAPTTQRRIFRSILEKTGLVNEAQVDSVIEKQAIALGYCIRCGGRIRHDLKTPFCSDCYKKWAQYKNERFTEKYCHTCGENNRTSFAYPQCRSCYRSG